MKRVLFLFLFLAACTARQPDQLNIRLSVDGDTQSIVTQVKTVGQFLREQNITLNELDFVRPNETSALQEDLAIVVTRVIQRTEALTQTIPFNTETLTDAALEPGVPQRRQAGQNGVRTLTYRITLQDGVETSRELINDEVTQAPINEIVRVGIKDIFSTTPFQGSIAFISNQNAFIMRETPGGRRPISSEGDLDGLVFDLSPDGRWLIYTRANTATLNSLWIADTSLASAEVNPLNVAGVLWAAWSPDGSSIAYSTAEPSAGPARWRAHNDLFILPIDSGRPARAQQILTENNSATYAWWGTTFAWSPTGDALAFTDADGIGLIDLSANDPEVVRLAQHAPFNTRSNYAWVPTPSWSPNGQFIYFTRHIPSQTGRSDEDSERFDVYAVSRDGATLIRVFNPAGMWSEPRIAPDAAQALMTIGQPERPFESNQSRYSLLVLDRDGSNRRVLFPDETQLGLSGRPDFDWSPDGAQLIIAYPTRPSAGDIQQGDLFMIDLSSGTTQQLTTDGTLRLPRWSR